MLTFFQESGKKETSFTLLTTAEPCLVEAVSLGVQSCCPVTPSGVSRLWHGPESRWF